MTILLDLIVSQGLTGQEYEKIAKALNAPTTIANEHAGEKETIVTPVVITLEGVMSLVPDAEAAAVYAGLPSIIIDLRDAITANNRQWLTKILGIVGASGKITKNTADALMALMSTTTTVENLQPETVQGPSLAAAAGLGIVTAEMVQRTDQETGGDGQYGNSQ